jgi:hypothetical protein
VTLEKLDKAYALEHLIDHLNLQGSPRQGKLFGSNALYLGDEVLVGGGNDYPVTKVPGLLIFAVNQDRARIPFLTRVVAGDPDLVGPEAVEAVIERYNRCARQLLAEVDREQSVSGDRNRHPTALDAFKKAFFGDRIQRKIERLARTETIRGDDWQALHAFVTLMSRGDPVGREWLLIAINMLDTIMTQIQTRGPATPIALASSHAD